MIEPRTAAGKQLLRSDFDTTGWGPSVVREHVHRAVAAIEAEAAAMERQRLRALYNETDAATFCNTDVLHSHQHGSCNARCWCSWADPDNCPYPA